MTNVDAIMQNMLDTKEGQIQSPDLPKFTTYATWLPRGGVGKTVLTHNIAAAVKNVMVVDGSPQCDLSERCVPMRAGKTNHTLYEILLPYFDETATPPNAVAQEIKDQPTNFIISGSHKLHQLPAMLFGSFNSNDQNMDSLTERLQNEAAKANTNKCLIDTSACIVGATHVALQAADALIIPLTVDQASLISFEFLLNVFADNTNYLSKHLSQKPKCQMVVINQANGYGATKKNREQLSMFVGKIHDLIRSNIDIFTSDNPSNHIAFVDDFRNTGLSGKQLTPMVSASSLFQFARQCEDNLQMITNQLKFIVNSLW